MNTFRVLVLFTCSLLTSQTMALGSCLTDSSQADFQAGTPFNVALLPGGEVELASSLTIDQQNQNVSGNGGTFHHFWWYAQTFTAGVSGPLTAVEVRLFCSGCASTQPDVRISIRAIEESTGEPTNVDLVSTTIPGFSSLAAQWYRATFASPITMSADTQYAIVVRSTAPLSSGQYGYLYSAQNSTYPDGFRFTSTTAGNSWTQQNFDTGFRVFTGGGFVAAGQLDSSVKDSNPGAGEPEWDTLSWNGTEPAGTALEFQAAASNSAAGPFNFVGPDGTSGTTWTGSGADLGQFDGFRYLKYKALLSTSNSSNTPVLEDVTVCFDVVEESADLSITKTDGQSVAAPGSSLVYNIIAGNAGPDPVPDALVTDDFPDELENCSWTCTGQSGGSCAGSGSGGINETVNLPVGGTVLFTASCDIAQSALGLLINTATVTSSITDPQPANNSASDTTSVEIPSLFKNGFE